MSRADIAAAWLHGEGIEIGALQHPLPVPDDTHVKYVDRLPVSGLREHYPELTSLPLVEADVIDDGERLAKFADGTLDFVIANHFVEHCQNPIAAIDNMLRVLRKGGTLYLAVPDKRFTFDVDRQVTPLEHLFEVHGLEHDPLRRRHYEEWVECIDKFDDPEKVRRHVDHLMGMDYSIHYHIWTPIDFLEFVASLPRAVSHRFEVEQFSRNHADSEVIVILRKSGT